MCDCVFLLLYMWQKKRYYTYDCSLANFKILTLPIISAASRDLKARGLKTFMTKINISAVQMDRVVTEVGCVLWYGVV